LQPPQGNWYRFSEPVPGNSISSRFFRGTLCSGFGVGM
jgi:hypothetical protein